MKNILKRLAAALMSAVFLLQCIWLMPAVVSAEDEMRGIWVSTVLNLDYPSKATTSEAALKSEADSIIAECSAMGINNIFLQVRPCSDAFYKSSVYPWSKYLTGTQGTAPEGDFDPLSYWISSAHSKGIKLHAWINPYRVTKSNDASDSEYNSLAASNPAKLHPEYIVKYSDNQYYFDPGLPEVRELLIEGALEIVKNYDVDGIHMDDYFYPGTGFNDADTYAKYGSGFSTAEDFRRNNVDLLVKELGERIHAQDPGCIFGISPSGIWANKTTRSEGSDTGGNESYTSYFADTRKWAQNEWIDYIAPQIYWNIGYSVADYKVLANWWAEQLKNCKTKLYIGLATYRSYDAAASSVWYGTDEIARQLALNRQISGIAGEIHFRYGLVEKNAAMKAYITSFYGGTPAAVPDKTPSSETPTAPSPAAVTKAETVTEATTSAPVAPKAVFTDITAYYNWAKEAINALVNADIVSGIGGNKFAPASNVRRADFLLMLVKALKLEGEEGEGFSDVKEGKYYAHAASLGKALGIVSGTGANRFRPEDYITRQDMMVMTEKALSVKANLADANQNNLKEFADYGQIADYAKQSIANLILIDVVSGSKGRINPLKNTTRAEAAIIIYKIYKLINGNS